MRAALLGHPEGGEGIRHRKPGPGDEGSADDKGDLDYLLKVHHKAQEQVAEEMLGLTRTLKEQSMAAKDIIKKDNAVIEKANEVADKNTAKLTKETERLQEYTRCSCRCWIWFLIAVVIFTFIGKNLSISIFAENFNQNLLFSAMVWVMKFFRKRTDY